MKNRKKILIVGSGGREHALGWKLRQSSFVGELFFAPGNGGTRALGKNVDIGVEEISRLVRFAKESKIDLTVVGPETALAKGIVDLFEASKLKVFGPGKAAARLESSKVWAVKFMEKYQIPHPTSKMFSEPKKAVQFLRTLTGTPMVIKADGLALGKGVVIADSTAEGVEAVDQIMVRKEFGKAGEKILIQEKLSGPELSVLALSDGKTIVPLLPSQDHKRALDGDKGPNTGGMGAYAPVPLVTPRLMQKIVRTVLEPTIAGMKKEGIPFVGVLYAGLMLTTSGLSVLEFNVRFGDPEIQPILMLLKSDLYLAIEACLDGKLDRNDIKFHSGFAASVVLTSGGYPGNYQKGEKIYGLDHFGNKDLQAFHAGTKVADGHLVSCGGRVLGITAKGKSAKEALKKAYLSVGNQGIHFKGMHFRKDIGKGAET